MRRSVKGIVAAVGLVLAVAPAAQAQEKKSSMAVMPFSFQATVRSNKDGITRKYIESVDTSLLTNKFITALVQTGKFDIVDRDKLDKILAEQQFGESGAVDPARAAKAGQMIGA